MLNLITQITIIHNNSSETSNDFSLANYITSQTNIDLKQGNPIGTSINYVDNRTNINAVLSNSKGGQSTTSHFFIEQLINSTQDVAFTFNWVNEVEISTAFKNQLDRAKITLPRNLDFDGFNIAKQGNNGLIPLFKRGDRIVISLGYTQTGLKKMFQGYISHIGMTTPLVIECEDMMYVLKQTRCQYPTASDISSGNSKLGLRALLERILLGQNNPLMLPSQDNFNFVNDISQLNTANSSSNKIPVIVSPDTSPFTYTTEKEKSVSEVINELKNKLGIYIFFDDFGNLHAELPYINLNNIASFKKFKYENQVIDDKNMKFQENNDIKLKVIYSSKRSNKLAQPPVLYAQTIIGGQITIDKNTGIGKIIGGQVALDAKGKPLNFVGDASSDSITVNAPDDMSQDDLNYYGLLLWQSQKYTGWAKGSTFETFGEPAVYLGEAVILDSRDYPEKNGTYAVVSVNRKFDINGYRQIIEIGPQLSKNNTSLK